MGQRKIVIYCNEHRQLVTYNYEKLPEEEDLKKKLYILEAYIKSIKKFKPSVATQSTGQPNPAMQGSSAGKNHKNKENLPFTKSQVITLESQDHAPF